jgi:TonB family protein
LLTLILVLTGFAWWQWQRSWNELERQSLPSESKMRVPSETINKRIVSKIEPEYPLAAQAVGAEGMVVLDAVIAPDGTVKSLRPLSGTDMLVRAASDAVRSWKFEPFLAAGQAVEVETTIAVEFRLH